MPWYAYTPSPDGGQPRPLLEVRLWHGARTVRVLALVDSGADRSMMNASYAEVLGLSRAHAVEERSVAADGREFTSLRWPSVEMQFGQERFAFEGVFVEFPPDADAVNLLGREDFFNRFIVQFWDAAELFNVDLSPDFPQVASEG